MPMLSGPLGRLCNSAFQRASVEMFAGCLCQSVSLCFADIVVLYSLFLVLVCFVFNALSSVVVCWHVLEAVCDLLRKLATGRM